MLDIIIGYHKRVLNNMLEENADYEDIVKESQILDDYINEKIKEIIT